MLACEILRPNARKNIYIIYLTFLSVLYIVLTKKKHIRNRFFIDRVVVCIIAEMDARGFHEYVFDGLQPDFQWPSIKFKRNYYPQGITSRGFSDDIFHQSFGMFEPLKRYAYTVYRHNIIYIYIYYII